MLKDYWIADSNTPPDMKLTAQQQLEFWAKQVDRNDADFQFPRIDLDGKLVDDVRRENCRRSRPYTDTIAAR